MSFFFLRDFLHSLASVVTCFSIFVNNREYIFSLFLCFFFTDYSRFFSILFVLQLPPSRISSSLLQISRYLLSSVSLSFTFPFRFPSLFGAISMYLFVFVEIHSKHLFSSLFSPVIVPFSFFQLRECNSLSLLYESQLY